MTVMRVASGECQVNRPVPGEIQRVYSEVQPGAPACCRNASTLPLCERGSAIVARVRGSQPGECEPGDAARDIHTSKSCDRTVWLAMK